MTTLNLVKNIILFSNPVHVLDKIAPHLFPSQMPIKNVAYMPCDGSQTEFNNKYLPYWQEFAKKHNVNSFNLIDNSQTGSQAQQQIDLLNQSNILIITGGNTFTLLNNLKKSVLDKAIIQMTQKPSFVIAGFSAGAAILTPNINILKYKWSYGQDINYVNLTDLTALNIVDFEVLPHYVEEDKIQLEQYKKSINNEVRCIADEEFILL